MEGGGGTGLIMFGCPTVSYWPSLSDVVSPGGLIDPFVALFEVYERYGAQSKNCIIYDKLMLVVQIAVQPITLNPY